MMIPTRWKDVQACARVIDPAGQMFYVLPRVVPFLVQLLPTGRNPRPVTIAIDPDAYVPVVLDPEAIAINTLRQVFPSIAPIGEQQ